LLSNNFIKKLICLTFLSAIISCSDRQEKIPVVDFQNNAQLLEIVKKHYNKEAQVAFGGLYDGTGKQFIAAGLEINNSDEWGIKFVFLEKTGDELKVIYETDVLEGSFKESFVNKIKFASLDYDLLYYNSQGYFMGSGGGEVFSYIVDLEEKQVYYAHLVVESETATSLFVSDNTINKELVNFFTVTLKKDYPNLKIVNEDTFVE
jgi:hypothetical protein